LDETVISNVIEKLGYKIKEKPFPVFTYQEAIRKYGADKFDLRNEADRKSGILAFAWIIDFPFFEKDKDGKWTFTHNPFSAPKPEHSQMLLKKDRIGEILTTQYDLVCNGSEVGGGSIRSNDAEILKTVFEIIGHKPDEIENQFGHMLNAFRYGVPPHGGIAHGIERLMMTVTGEPYLREVVAFPQTAGGQTSVMDAPSEVSQLQLDELGIEVKHLSGGESVYEKIISELKNKNLRYHSYTHKAVTTSAEAAAVRNTPVSWGAKAIVMIGDGKPVMVVVAGDTKIDTKKLKVLTGVHDLRMATPDEVLKTTSVPVGAVPPFGHLFNIQLFMDSKIRNNPTVVFNAGLHTKSIQIAESDFEIAAGPKIGDFSK
jgi:prolyl-tRNA editing enzyme YbaK/EbsC (Cys-tRNA(Pro) deacylase)